MTLRWTPEKLDQLERAAREGRRVALFRRGTEYIVTVIRMTTSDNKEAVIGRIPMTGEEMVFVLTDLEGMQLL